jgi:putative ABC transport system permease protein
VSPGERFYSILLLLYPRSFRERFGAEMRESFRAERARSGGAGFWLGILADVAASAPRSRARAFRNRRRAKRGARVKATSWDRDLRCALRSIASSPGVSLAIVATLALGLGAVTSVASIVDAVLLRPLPYPDSDRLVRIWDSHETTPYFSVTAGNFLAWKEEAKTFQAMGAYREEGLDLILNGEPLGIRGARATAGLFRVLAIEPELGRVFDEEDDRPSGPRVVVLTHGLWMSAFGGAPDAVGRTLTLAGQSFTIVGVLPRSFHFPQQRDVGLIVPFALDPAVPARKAHFLRVLGRLRKGASPDEAEAELSTIARRLATAFPETNEGWSVAVVPLREATVHDVRAGLRVLLGAVVLLLLVASVNVSNLALARSHSRSRELWLRSALGASRGRLARQILLEQVLLSFAGGAVGLAIAAGAVAAVPLVLPSALPRQEEITLDATLFLIAFALAALTGVATGLVPAVRASNGAVAPSPRIAGGDGRVRRSLVAGEVGLAVMLLVGAGLLVRTLSELGAVELGFDPHGVLTMEVTPVAAIYPAPSDRVRFYREMLERLSTVPGATSSAAVHRLPLDSGNSVFPAFVAGREAPETSQFPAFNYRAIGGNYFGAMGMSLLAGRGFTESETWERGEAVVVNQEMASVLWPAGDALGSRIGPSPKGPWLEVVGIVSNARETGIRQEPEAAMYLPYVVAPVPTMTLLVRSPNDPDALVGPVREAFRSQDSTQPVPGLASLSEHVYRALGEPRFHADLLSLFAGLALMLATVGIHGVVADAVRHRKREIGIRMALGARAGDVLRMTWSEGMWPVLAGLSLGLVGAALLSRTLGSFLYGVSPIDPLSFLGVPVLFVSVASVANFLPALSATRVDPVETLRSE